MDKNENDQRVSRMFGEIVKLIPERSKIKTDLLYFKYAPILVMLFRWYGVSQFYDNKMEITHVYVANMARADFYKSSIKDEEQLAQFIKDMVDDADQKDGFIFNRFYADCCHNGVPIPWEDVL